MLNLRNAFFRNVAHGVMALLGMLRSIDAVESIDDMRFVESISGGS